MMIIFTITKGSGNKDTNNNRNNNDKTIFTYNSAVTATVVGSKMCIYFEQISTTPTLLKCTILLKLKKKKKKIKKKLNKKSQNKIEVNEAIKL